MKPTNKSPGIAKALNTLIGGSRERSVHESMCIPPPIGCGQEVKAEEFRDECSRREYKISGLCMKCQDKIFGNGY